MPFRLPHARHWFSASPPPSDALLFHRLHSVASFLDLAITQRDARGLPAAFSTFIWVYLLNATQFWFLVRKYLLPRRRTPHLHSAFAPHSTLPAPLPDSLHTAAVRAWAYLPNIVRAPGTAYKSTSVPGYSPVISPGLNCCGSTPPRCDLAAFPTRAAGAFCTARIAFAYCLLVLRSLRHRVRHLFSYFAFSTWHCVAFASVLRTPPPARLRLSLPYYAHLLPGLHAGLFRGHYRRGSPPPPFACRTWHRVIQRDTFYRLLRRSRGYVTAPFRL